MKISRYNLTWMIVLPITFGLATSGCATKKYVRSQVDVVNQRVSHVETKTKEQMAYLTNKEDADISQVKERIMTTDNKVAENAAAIRQTNATAEQAMQTAQSNESKISANEAALTKLDAAMNYTLIEKGDVTFGFNKSVLDNEAKVALDAIIQRAQSSPRTVVELVGFTDPIGSTQYNLTLSRRRAEAVQRYLVKNNVPLRGIHIIGMGKEQPPASLTADVQAVDPNASPKDIRRLARRVYIRVYSTGLAQGEAARSTPNP
jgi:outer membrane protein OmpA-like peptidoglycan-associated protein